MIIKHYIMDCENSELIQVSENNELIETQNLSNTPINTITTPIDIQTNNSILNSTSNINLEDEYSNNITDLDLKDEVKDESFMNFRYNKKPCLVATAEKCFLNTEENFLKGCKWSPDGLCILTSSNDSKMRLFNMPNFSEKSNSLEIDSELCIEDGEMIYDYNWYPCMKSTDPNTCCFISTSRRSPIHLWDAYDGRLRASYRCFDGVDEMVSAYCVNFDTIGNKIVCGLKQQINIFDITTPGREYDEIKTASKSGGQRGIISCIAYSEERNKLFAAGSYSATIGLYNVEDLSINCMFQGHIGGVTHIMFSDDGNYLFTGGRKDPEIICWDIRKGEILFCLRRNVETNQRMYFDITNNGKYLFSGNHDGSLTIWDLKSEPEIIGNEPVLNIMEKFNLHSDSLNGVSIHPMKQFLATTSGQRKFPFPNDYLSSDEESDILEVFKNDYSLKIWKWS